MVDSQKIVLDKDLWDSSRMPLNDVELLSCKFCTTVGTGNAEACTGYYDIVAHNVVETSSSDFEYHFALHKPITEEWLGDPIGSSSQMDSSLFGKFYKRQIENRPEFDGRFFVKIARDEVVEETIFNQATISFSKQYVQTDFIPFYYLADGDSISGDNTTGNSSSLTKMQWRDNLDPDNNGTPESFWFIDAAHYEGYYGITSNGYNYMANEGMYTRGPQNCPTLPLPAGLTYHDYFAHNATYQNHPTSHETGFNKGIYTELDANGNPQTYIDLSFSQIKGAGAADDPHLHTDEDNNGAADACCYGTGATDMPVWTEYYEDVRDTSGTNQMNKYWEIGSSQNAYYSSSAYQDQVIALAQGRKFRFLGDEDTIYTITGHPEKRYHVNFQNIIDIDDSWVIMWGQHCGNNPSYVCGAGGSTFQADMDANFALLNDLGHATNKRIRWKIPIDKDPTDPNVTSYNPIHQTNLTAPPNTSQTGGIQFVELAWVDIDGQIVGKNPAIWETEPKEDIDLDIYYEVDGTFPLFINKETNETFAPPGTLVTHTDITYQFPSNATVVSWNDNIVELDQPLSEAGFNNSEDNQGLLTFHRKDGSCVTATLIGLADPIISGPSDSSFHLEINSDVSVHPVNLAWYNCFSFGNGVESNRIRDDYNQLYIDKGAKASSTIDEPYEEERRKYGLIYSGLYNSTSGVNNLNQFIQAEKITKDLNPIYGSIQKLHARDADLITLCEDKVLKILSNKDAVFNADNNPQLTATNKVLGQTIPFVGEFGISKNPESFTSESYRSYFTDKVRGSVMRLSMDGLTPISMHGMKDWFRDNLKLSNKLIGSYDDKKDEYNITLKSLSYEDPVTSIITHDVNTTVSFREDVKGWVSFKSFIPENGVSCANEYFTFNDGKIWKHHIEDIDRNTFYNIPSNSSVNILLSEAPGSIKSFTTLNYEGSKSKIDQFTIDQTTGLTDGEYYNLKARDGWWVDSIFTDLETGSLNEFIEKEGKWFNYIKGENVRFDVGSNILMNTDGSSTFDQASFAIQGIGVLNTVPVITQISGCTDSTMFNFDPAATIDDGSCVAIFMGCTESSASNFPFNNPPNTDDGSCVWIGCTCANFPSCINTTPFPPEAFTYLGGAGLVDNGTCVQAFYGCTDNSTFTQGGTIYNTNTNFDPSANVNAVSATDLTNPCIPTVLGCMLQSANNFNSLANTNDGTCTWTGCTQPLAPNFTNFPAEAQSYIAFAGVQYGIQDDGSCTGGGCTDPISQSFDPAALWDDGSCIYFMGCMDPLADNYYAAAQMDDGSCLYFGCTDVWAINYDCQTSLYIDPVTGVYTAPTSPCSDGVNQDDGNCVMGIPGCMDSTACNYDPAANIDPGNVCEFETCAGCMDSTANNYNLQLYGSAAGTGCYLNGNVLQYATCTIACGNGIDGNPGIPANGCCTYTILGCTDDNFCNYDPAATVDNGSCSNASCTGCMDSSALNYNTANIYDCAGVAGGTDYSCCNYTPTSGCTNSTACNYDATAVVDDGSCVYGFSNAVIGDPATTDLNGNSVSTPVFYNDTQLPTLSVKHFVFNSATSLNISPEWPNGTSYVYPTNQTLADASIYPADTYNEYDVGLSFQSASPYSFTNLPQNQYGSSDKIIIELYKQDSNGNSWSMVHTKDIVNPGFFNLQAPSGTNPTFGDRINSMPYTFGGTFGATSAQNTNNYEFDIYQADGVTKQYYAVSIYSEINGVQYGKHDGPTPNCGTYNAFDFTTLSLCDHNYAAIIGCTDPLACNYPASGVPTCPVNCIYPTNPTYMWSNDPNNAAVNICQQEPCLFPASPLNQFATLSACCAAHPGSGGPCPQI